MAKYNVIGYKKFITLYGIKEEEPVYFESFNSAKKAVEEARELYEDDSDIVGIYISLDHSDSAVYVNSNGLDFTGENWVKYFDEFAVNPNV